jgi:hypothetical protein
MRFFPSTRATILTIHLSSDVSVMELKIQSLPQELRTMHPQTWTTENGGGWFLK